MGLKDINLGFNGSHEINNLDLIAGTEIECLTALVNRPRILMHNGEMIAQLSNSFDKKITNYEARGYHIEKVEIESVIHWHDSDNKMQKIHPLCHIRMRKN
jgi:hypothetical protein